MLQLLDGEEEAVKQYEPLRGGGEEGCSEVLGGKKGLTLVLCVKGHQQGLSWPGDGRRVSRGTCEGCPECWRIPQRAVWPEVYSSEPGEQHRENIEAPNGGKIRRRVRCPPSILQSQQGRTGALHRGVSDSRTIE